MQRMEIYRKQSSFGKGLNKKKEGDFPLKDPFFSYASSSTLYPCEWVGEWVVVSN